MVETDDAWVDEEEEKLPPLPFDDDAASSSSSVLSPLLSVLLPLLLLLGVTSRRCFLSTRSALALRSRRLALEARKRPQLLHVLEALDAVVGNLQRF